MRVKLVASLLALFIIAAITTGVLLWRYHHQPLISPAVGLSYQLDLSPLISRKVSPAPTIYYSTDVELPSLATVPRYLSYNLRTGIVYAAKKPLEKTSPASFTKLLSGQVALDLLNPEQYLTIAAKATEKEPTVLGLKAGEQLTVAELLRGSISTSGNDAATALAMGVSNFYGLDLSYFYKLMNEKALLLGMKDSYFGSADGLDALGQTTTLIDLTKLINNTVQFYPPIMEAAKSDRADIEANQYHGRYYLPNWNGLLGVYPGTYGLKIAYTETAGYSTIVMAKRGEEEIVAIVSGADSIVERDMAAAALLDAGYLVEGMAPANVTRTALRRHYNEWAKLAEQIRRELDALKKS